MNPLVSHPLVAALDTLVLSILAHVVLGFAAIELPYLPIVAAVVVSAVYYGREADSVEHTRKNFDKWGWFYAFVGGKYIVGWRLENFLQWVVAAVGALVTGGLIQVLS